MTSENDDMIKFDGVTPTLERALNTQGYSKLTPVQSAVLEDKIGARDALVSAQTGSGKTVAFGLALAPTLLNEAGSFEAASTPLALIIAPTRELALQIKREISWLYQYTGAQIASCVGGMDMRTERRTLERGAHIVVGTPGRLRDHITRGSFETSGLLAVVLDEADEMLDLGFREDLEFILQTAPEQRRTLLFSATVPRAIASLAKKFQTDAVRIQTTGEAKQHVDISYRVLEAAATQKENAIINVLRFYEAKNALVFCNTRAAVNHMTARFNNRGFAVVALSGELSQAERSQALQAMRDGRARVCIATDVAARGIDLPNLDLVIHADLPTNSDTLLHRSGRTGRAGRKGVSALIVAQSGRRRAARLLASARIDAQWAAPPSASEITSRDNERLLSDPVLSAPLADDEREFVRELLSKYEPEQIGAAFIRQSRAGKSSPEELQLITPRPPGDERGFSDRNRTRGAPRRPSADFEDGVWFRLSVGRKQRAEPRWLIPMLCKCGNLTKRDIGAIRLQSDESHVELTTDGAERLIAAIGDSGALEKGITAAPMQTGMPASRGSSRNATSGGNSRSGPSGSKARSTSSGDRSRYAPSGGGSRYTSGSERPRATSSGRNPSRGTPGGDRSRGAPSQGRSDRKPARGARATDAPVFDRNAGPAKPYRADRPAKPYKPDRSDRSDRADRADRSEKPYKKADRSYNANRSYNADRPRKPDNSSTDRTTSGQPASPGKPAAPARPAHPSTAGTDHKTEPREVDKSAYPNRKARRLAQFSAADRVAAAAAQKSKPETGKSRPGGSKPGGPKAGAFKPGKSKTGKFAAAKSKISKLLTGKSDANPRPKQPK